MRLKSSLRWGCARTRADLRSAWQVCHHDDPVQRSADERAFLPAHLKLIESPVSPAVRWILVRDGQKVRRAGEPLIELDAMTTGAELAEAGEALGEARLAALATAVATGVAPSLAAAPEVPAERFATEQANLLDDFYDLLDSLGSVVLAHGKSWYVGNDLIYAPSWSQLDPILRPSGDDTIDAGAGNDQVHAGEDRDTIMGGTGEDYLGDGDNDVILDAGTENDTVRGNGGNDTIFGGEGSDWLFGRDMDQPADPNDLDIDETHGRAGNEQVSGDDGGGRLFGGDVIRGANAWRAPGMIGAGNNFTPAVPIR